MDINSHVPTFQQMKGPLITLLTLKMLPLDITCIAFCVHTNSSKQDMVGKAHPAQAEMPHCCSHKTIKEIGWDFYKFWQPIPLLLAGSKDLNICISSFITCLPQGITKLLSRDCLEGKPFTLEKTGLMPLLWGLWFWLSPLCSLSDTTRGNLIAGSQQF